MDTIALLFHASAGAVVAYRGGQPVSAQQLLEDARRLAHLLPAGRHVLNVCGDRYRFAVGFAACLISGRVSLLPSTHTPEVIGQMAAFAPDAAHVANGQEELAKRKLLPKRQLVDSSYVGSQIVLESRRKHGISLSGQ